jgi:hypothetical protein
MMMRWKRQMFCRDPTYTQAERPFKLLSYMEPEIKVFVHSLDFHS